MDTLLAETLARKWLGRRTDRALANTTQMTSTAERRARRSFPLDRANDLTSLSLRRTILVLANTTLSTKTKLARAMACAPKPRTVKLGLWSPLVQAPTLPIQLTRRKHPAMVLGSKPKISLMDRLSHLVQEPMTPSNIFLSKKEEHSPWKSDLATKFRMGRAQAPTKSP